jgi:MoaD family protein
LRDGRMPRVKLYNIFRNRIGKPELELPADGPMTLDALLDVLEARAEGFRTLVLGENGRRPREGVAVMVNGRAVLAADALQTPIRPTDEVTFVPAISGG